MVKIDFDQIAYLDKAKGVFVVNKDSSEHPSYNPTIKGRQSYLSPNNQM